MISSKNLPAYVLSGLIFIALKWWHAHTGVAEVSFIIKPVSALVGLATGTGAQWIDGTGYHNPGLHIIINKSCSGINFWLLCFMLLALLGINYARTAELKAAAVAVALFAAYLLTLPINAARILSAVFINRMLTTLHMPPPDWLHPAEGSFVYLFFLILIYLVADRLMNKPLHPYANPA